MHSGGTHHAIRGGGRAQCQRVSVQEPERTPEKTYLSERHPAHADVRVPSVARRAWSAGACCWAKSPTRCLKQVSSPRRTTTTTSKVRAGPAPRSPLAGGPDAMLSIRTHPPAGQSSNLRVAGSLFRTVSPLVSSLLNRLQAHTTLCLRCSKKGASLST